MTLIVRLARAAGDFGVAVRNLGLRNALHLKVQQRRLRDRGRAEPVALRSKYAAHPVLCRPGTSDAGAFYHVFLTREYSCLDDIPDPGLILDLGANVGYSSAYFLSRWPAARIVAVEPDPGNADLLERNLASFGDRARIVRGAVWSHPTGLVLDTAGGDRREWARRVRECGPGETPAVVATDIPTLLGESGFPTISVLKVDIEGAERAVFSGDCRGWLGRVENIVIELHGEECRQTFDRAIAGLPFARSRCGELTVCKRTRPV